MRKKREKTKIASPPYQYHNVYRVMFTYKKRKKGIRHARIAMLKRSRRKKKKKRKKLEREDEELDPIVGSGTK